jgi:hypothetical protein
MTLKEAIDGVNKCVHWERNGEHGFEFLSIDELEIVLSAARKQLATEHCEEYEERRRRAIEEREQ